MKIKEGKQIGFVIKKGINVDKQFQYGKCIFEQGFDSAGVGVSEVTLNGTIGKNLKSYTIKGNTVQNGTPAPDNPVDVLGVGDKTGNLIPYVDRTITSGNFTFTVNKGIAHITGTHTASGGRLTYTIDNGFYLDAGTYTLSTNSPYQLYWFISNKVTNQAINTSAAVLKQNKTITLTEKTFVTVGCNTTANYDYGEIDVWVMLNEGSTALPYEPYGYKLPMLTMGSNLYNINDETNRRHLWHSSMHYVYDPDRTLIFIPCKSAETYTLYNFYNPSVIWSISQSQYIPEDGVSYAIDGATTSVSLTGLAHYTLTTNTKAKYIAVSVAQLSSIESFFGKLMICKSNYKSSPYEPYREPVVSNVYLDEPLYSGDYIKLNTDGSGVVHRVWRKLALTGEETGWMLRGGTPADICFISQENLGINAVPHNGICNAAKITENSTFADLQEGEFILSATNIGFRLPSYTSTTESWRTFLRSMYAAGTPVTVIYQLATPTDTPITLPDIPTLKALPPLHTYDGATTVISVDTTVSPSKFDAAYKSNVLNPYKIEYHTADNIGFASADGAVFTTRY